MSEAKNRIERLRREARTCRDPERLRQIASALTLLGQWLDAKRISDKAWEIEKSLAEAA